MDFRIRKYTIIALVIVITSLLIIGSIYRNRLNVVTHDNFYYEDNIKSLFKSEDKGFKIFKAKSWQDFEIKGIELTAFTPGYTRGSDTLDKEEFQLWLQQIQDLKVNVLYVPYLQTNAFYEEIYKFNMNNPNPLFILQGIPIDESLIQSSYDAFDYKLNSSIKKDIRIAVDALHGRRISFENRKYHSGVYIRDISPFIFGYIIGNNTSPEFVHLTNSNNSNINSYNGSYFNVESGNPMDCFVAEIMDYLVDYETSRYNQKNVVSYYSSPLTDPLEHEYETNFTRYSNINIENIRSKDSGLLFAAYEIFPNYVDFLQYENFTIEDNEDIFDNWYTFSDYVKDLEKFHDIPTIALNLGMSSARVKTIQDYTGLGFHRGGLSEKEQGEKLVELIEICNQANFSGVVLSGWQDNWSRKSPFNYIDIFGLNTSKVHNVMASEENTGLISFEYGKTRNIVYIDGDFSEWTDSDVILEEKDLSISAKGDTAYLYLMIKKSNWSLTEDNMILGIDISKDIGSDIIEGTDTKLPINADFLVDLTSYNESEIKVHERSDVFSYLYKYYTNLIEKKSNKPSVNSPVFNSIFQLNRRNFELKSINKKIHPLYSDASKLLYGNGNPNMKEYNSLVDFNKNNDCLEIRIPWSLINIVDPVDRYAIVDSYDIQNSGQVGRINEINFALYYESESEVYLSKVGRFTLPKFRDSEYHTRLKESYWILKEFWGK